MLVDGTWREWTIGFGFIAVSAIPSAVIGFLYRLSRMVERPHPLLIAFLWTVLVIGAPLAVLSLVDGPPEPVLPFVIFILALFVYLLTWFRARLTV